MDPTTKWMCDTCGEQIETVADGWVEWISFKDSTGQRRGRGIRIVHHKPASPQKNGCQYNEEHEFATDRGTVRDLPLESFMGADGLTRLLSILSQNELPQDEVIEIIQRIHIPGYEQARPYFDRAIHDGEIEPNLPEGFYWQSMIERVTKKYCEK